MERITRRDSLGQLLWPENSNGEPCMIDEIHEKLEAYELTGLTPEEITSLKEQLTEYKRLEEEGLLIKLPSCEVGDIIFEVDRPEYGIIYCEVTRIYFVKGYVCGVKSNGKFRQIIIEVSIVDGHGKGSAYHFTDDEFGKLVFFTREEAEAKLKGSE